MTSRATSLSSLVIVFWPSLQFPWTCCALPWFSSFYLSLQRSTGLQSRWFECLFIVLKYVVKVLPQLYCVSLTKCISVQGCPSNTIPQLVRTSTLQHLLVLPQKLFFLHSALVFQSTLYPNAVKKSSLPQVLMWSPLKWALCMFLVSPCNPVQAIRPSITQTYLYSPPLLLPKGSLQQCTHFHSATVQTMLNQSAARSHWVHFQRYTFLKARNLVTEQLSMYNVRISISCISII